VDNRMLNIDEQAKATIDAGTDIETRYLAAELKLDINKRVFTQDNPKIREQQMELNELRKQRESLMKDRKSDLLIPYRQAPELGLQMVRLKRDLKIQEALFEFILQQYETAKFDESKNTPNVQVLDKAVAAQKRSFPKRGKIVIGFAFFSLFLGIGIVSFLEYFRRFAVAKPDEFRMIQQIRRNIWGKKSAPT
jgi:tyrosine-protein kinase Etk/Wzc